MASEEKTTAVGAVDTGAPAARPEAVIRANRFLETLKGTHEEVYLKLLKSEAGLRAMNASSWRSLLEEIKGRPVGRK
jgi:hypothetical protein